MKIRLMYATLFASVAVILYVGLLLVYDHAPGATEEAHAFVRLAIFDFGVYVALFAGVLGFAFGGKEEDRVHKHEHTVTDVLAIIATGTLIAPWFIL